MISQNLSVHKWAVRALKLGMATSIVLSLSSCSDDDEDLLGNWVRLGTFNGVPRSGAVAVVLNEKAYIGTGYDDDDIDDNNINKLKDFWVMNESGSWTQLAFLPDEALHRDEAVGFAVNGKIYLGTGSGETSQNNRLKDFWAYDPAGDTWSPVSDFPGSARYGAIAFSIGNKGYVCSGNDGGWQKDLWEYDPATDSWDDKASYGGDKREDAVVFVINDIAYVCTGTNNGSALRDFYSYNASEDKWTKLRDIADTDDDESFDDDYDNIVRSGGVAFAVDGKGYVCTSSTSNGSGTSVWEYDPATDLWDEKTSFEGTTRTEAVGFAINNVGYVATGRSSSYYLDDIWRFEPNAEQEDDDNY